MTRVVLSIGSNLGTGWRGCSRSSTGWGRGARRVTGVRDRPLGPGRSGAVPERGADRRRPGLRRAGLAGPGAGVRARGGQGPRRALGPRTLDVDLIACYGQAEVTSRENNLTLPHPLAHLRAFVLIPWLAVDPDARLTVAEGPRPVAQLLAELEPADRAAVRRSDLTLELTT